MDEKQYALVFKKKTAVDTKKNLKQLTAGILKKRRTDISCTHPSGKTQLAAAKLFVCFCIVRVFEIEEEDSVQNLHSVLFCLTKKHSV